MPEFLWFLLSCRPDSARDCTDFHGSRGARWCLRKSIRTYAFFTNSDFNAIEPIPSMRQSML